MPIYEGEPWNRNVDERLEAAKVKKDEGNVLFKVNF